MSTQKPTMKGQRDSTRHRLATNRNETIVVERRPAKRHRLAGNHNETIVVDR
jgi:hypothetical protein